MEQAALLLAASGIALGWILPYLFSESAVPPWIVARWHLLVCAPAFFSGLSAFKQHAGFARAPIVLGVSALIAAGIAWTDPTEVGRGALIAAAVLVPLPVAALIRKHDFLERFLLIFSSTTATSQIYAFTTPSSFQVGRLVDSTGTATTNPNSVGIQAALAALFLLIIFPRRKSLNTYLFTGLITILVVASFLTASRTAIIAMAGAGLVAMFFLRSRVTFTAIVKGGSIALCCLAINAALDSQHLFYEGIVRRLVQDDEETRDTFGGRMQIWEFAAKEFADNNTWLYGKGTGGVDKTLGGFEEAEGAAQGADGIWRLSPHNTLIWWTLAFGVTGTLAYVGLGWGLARTAYRLDRKFGDWRRSTILAFIALSGSGAVITQEGSWFVLGPALLVMLSNGVLFSRRQRILYVHARPEDSEIHFQPGTAWANTFPMKVNGTCKLQ